VVLPKTVRIVEVGPRDGLQNEPLPVSVEARVSLIEGLADAGVKTIECGSFVSPKWVPQMADTGSVLKRLRRRSDVSYTVLVPNAKGFEEATRHNIGEIAVFAAASETFSQRNINCSITESLQRLGSVTELACANGVKVRGYVSCVLGCPFEGDIPPEAVVRVSEELLGMGCYEISLGDTIGVGTPLKTETLLEAISRIVPINRLAVHFHDTWGQALANILTSLELGISVVDSSVAGLGGCPYAPGATGNVATEDVLYMLDGMDIETGVDLEKVAYAGRSICEALGRKPASKAAVALEARCYDRDTAEKRR